MKNRLVLWLLTGTLFFSNCSIPNMTVRDAVKQMPDRFNAQSKATETTLLNWHQYFTDPHLTALIDTALRHNQELNVVLQEIEISKNEIRARKGEYLPFVRLGASSAVDKTAQYTRFGAVDENLPIKEGKAFPKPFSDHILGATATWEVDIWKKLRNAKQAAVYRYLSTVEGQHFMVTNLVAEIADAYYELLSLDNLLQIIDQNIEIQTYALNVVKQQKEAARATQLAVNRFEAQLLNTQHRQYDIKQQITEIENRINFLTGRYPTPITRAQVDFTQVDLGNFEKGIPAQLLLNRPDVKAAEMNLAASKLDVKVARARFLPSLDIQAGLGLQAFNPVYLISPKSIAFNLAGDLMAPLINRNAIKADYFNANARQLQAVFAYEQAILKAYVDVQNQLAKINNYTQGFNVKKQEVDILRQAVSSANSLYNAARADYSEVLLTQREAIEAKFDMIEAKKNLLQGQVNIYRALGGGWQ